MGKDYFTDIDSTESRRTRRPSSDEIEGRDVPSAEKSIRNISVSPRRAMLQRPNPSDNRDLHSHSEGGRVKRSSRFILWGVAALSVLVLGGLAFVLLSAKTTVDITPRTHQITFDPATQFTAYPQDATGSAIVYSTRQVEAEDSVTVPATGTEKATDRASGTITVYNAYSANAVRLIKNTRFESPTGLVFRIPASIEVPGKKGSTPGQIDVTVFADQPGPDYNIAATDKFTVPGLKNSPDMYNGVYARSSAAFSGGFVGDKPAVSSGALEAARAEIRGRLETKIKESIRGISDGYAFENLARVTYESLPTVADPAGGARVSEKARAHVAVFPSDTFAHAIAQAVSADAAESKVRLVPRDAFGAQSSGDIPETLGSAPLVFTLTGSALVVWEVDENAVREALVGKDESAFKPIIGTFLGIKDAKARVAPFWSSTFPREATNIEVVVRDPTKTE